MTSPLFLSSLVLASCLSLAEGLSPVSLSPGNWRGIDGNWSTLSFGVGAPGQKVDVLASTTLSEFWAIAPGGCLLREPLCGNSRGGIFDPRRSDGWTDLGTWSLGQEQLQYGGNGDYGTDSINQTDLSGNEFKINEAIIATVNITEYYLGYFGLNIIQGNFDDEVHESPITQAVKEEGVSPSYSYGYTAGAHYKGSGAPVSLTLGGYDQSRFEPHDITFTLRQGNTPMTYVRGISASLPVNRNVPDNWDTRTRELSNKSMAFDAIVDSTTPFMWFPDAVCDEFADAFGLEYNDTLNLYVLNNLQFEDFRASTSFSFTFSLSSFDDHDDFGKPLETNGVVNITISAAAFAQALRYPFEGELIGYGDPAVPYFPLRRNGDSDSTSIIGRSFLQESYLVTKYDSGTFSIHQALFPDDPDAETDIQAIEWTDSSPFPKPAKVTNAEEEDGDTDEEEVSGGLTTAQMGGIAAGIISLCLIMLIVWLCLRRRKKQKQAEAGPPVGEEGKDGCSITTTSEPSTPMTKFFALVAHKKRKSQATPEPETERQEVHEAPGSTVHPAEVGADANHAVYEMPAPMTAMELDGSTNDEYSYGADMATGSGNADDHAAAYASAKRNMETQLRGPVPPYSPPSDPSHLPTDQKLAASFSPVVAVTTLAADHHSPTLPPMSREGDNLHPGSSPNRTPSPVSLRGDASDRDSHAPSALSHDRSPTHPLFSPSHPTWEESELLSAPGSDESNTLPSLVGGSSSWSSQQTNSSSFQPAPAPLFSGGGASRPQIDPTKVVCLGPLPEHDSAPQGNQPADQNTFLDLPGLRPGYQRHQTQQSVDTLGSNFTDIETQRMEAATVGHYGKDMGRYRQGSASSQGGEPPTWAGKDRIGTSSQLVHVPQPAERRFSWEE